MTAILTDATKNLMLDAIPDTWHIGLHSAFPPAGGNEATGGSPAYARKGPITWPAASGGAVSMTAPAAHDVPAGFTVRAVAFWSASTAGTLTAWMPAGSSARRAIAVTAADLTNNDIQSEAHGLAAGNSVLFWATIGTGLPEGLSEDTEYFVIATGLTADSFRVSTTLGGSAVDITGAGDGDVQKFTPEAFAGQGTYQVSAATISLPG